MHLDNGLTSFNLRESTAFHISMTLELRSAGAL